MTCARALGLVLAAAVAGASCQNAAAHAAGLPYYATADFFPQWTKSTHHIGEFALRTQTGERFTSQDLSGRPHVASFIYTRCSSLCPTLVSSLKTIASRLPADRVTIVSFSVTPDLDTPGVLAAFGRTHAIDPARWKLLTGPRDEIYRLARESYFATDERLSRTLDQEGAILHTEKLVLVDADGHLRGVYDGTQPFELDHLVEDARALIAR